MVRELLAQGAKTETKDKNGYTALIAGKMNLLFIYFIDLLLLLASWRGHVEVVRELLTGGANTESKDKDGYTALIAGTMIDYSFIYFTDRFYYQLH